MSWELQEPGSPWELAKATKKLRNGLKAETESDYQHFTGSFSPYHSDDYSLWRATKQFKRSV